MCCLLLSSPVLSAAATATARPPSSFSPVLPVDRRQCRLLRPGETTGRCLAVRAQSRHRGRISRDDDDDDEPPLPPNHFVEKRNLVTRRFMQVCCIYEGYVYQDAIAMSGNICLSAEKAITMASKILDSAIQTTYTPPDGISADTIHLTLGVYVDVFVQTAEDSYNGAVFEKTVTSFLDALRGLVSISHILLEAALEALGHTHPKESLSEYAFNNDIKTMYNEFNCQMNDLEDGIVRSSYYRVCRLVSPTIRKGVTMAKSFVGVMTARRQRALEKAKI